MKKVCKVPASTSLSWPRTSASHHGVVYAENLPDRDEQKMESSNNGEQVACSHDHMLTKLGVTSSVRL